MKKQRHPANAPGDFYVMDGYCLACQAPEHEAPDLMANTEASGMYHCFFQKQPSSPEEVDRAINAVCVGCCGAVRYGGKDPAILREFKEFAKRIKQLNYDNFCDHKLNDKNV